MSVNIPIAYCDGIRCFVDFAILGPGGELLAADIFNRGATSVRSMLAKMASCKEEVHLSGRGSRRITSPLAGDGVPECRVSSLSGGYDGVYRGTYASPLLGKKFLLTSTDTLEEDFYSYLMVNYDLPLIKKWTLPFFHYLKDCRYFTSNEVGRYEYDSAYCRKLWCAGRAEDHKILLGGHVVTLNKIILLDFGYGNLNQDALDEAYQALIERGDISLTDRPMNRLQSENIDEYLNEMSESLFRTLNRSIQPITKLGEPTPVAMISRHLYSQQRQMVNGVCGLWRSGHKTAFAVEEMGSGKTLQGIAACEAYSIQKWLNTHPGKTLKDALSEPGNIRYRTVIMAPGHLVGKWQEEILRDVPYAKAVILTDLSQLTELKKKGSKPSGREFYIVSKEVAKLSYYYAPAPSRITEHGKLRVPFCKECRKNGHLVRVTPGKACRECGGFEVVLDIEGSGSGIQCPHCFNLLWREQGGEKILLSSSDFEHRNTMNNFCQTCGGALWGPGVAGESGATWVRVTHFKDVARKSRVTDLVMKSRLESFLATAPFPHEEKEVSINPCSGTRRYSLALFIRKQMRGFFDFCVLDEVHKYSSESSQGDAAHCLANASRHVLCLTGTIANGKASSLFKLLFRLDPVTMRSLGYSYADETKFIKKYGSVEEKLEVNGTAGKTPEEYASCSRGRKVSSSKEKPGISPMIYSDVLIRSCQLNLSDFSDKLPSFTETVRVVPMGPLKDPYDRLLREVNRLGRKEKFRYSGEILHLAMNYPDKPYDRLPVMSKDEEGVAILVPENHPELVEFGALLPKEQEIVNIISEELAEGRNCCLYIEGTGNSENYLIDRMKQVLLEHTEVSENEIAVLTTAVKLADREEWIRDRMREGVKVLISNPKLCETGLDFCFNENGHHYCIPTIIYGQLTMELAVMWQASRRSYRLITQEPARVYYLCYEDTLQMKYMEVMALKQSAVSAISGKFSSGGLAAMAKGVDVKTVLANAINDNYMGDRNKVEAMFSAAAQAEGAVSLYDGFGETPVFSELGLSQPKEEGEPFTFELFSDLVPEEPGIDSSEGEEFSFDGLEEEPEAGDVCEDPFAELMADFGFLDFCESDSVVEMVSVIPTKKKKKKKPSISASFEW